MLYILQATANTPEEELITAAVVDTPTTECTGGRGVLEIDELTYGKTPLGKMMKTLVVLKKMQILLR